MAVLNKDKVGEIISQVSGKSVESISKNWITLSSGAGTIYVSQCKPSGEGEGHWEYEFFHTLALRTVEKIREIANELILLDYVRLRYVRLVAEDVDWIIENSTREKSNDGVTCDFVVNKSTDGSYFLRPYYQQENEARRGVEVHQLNEVKEPSSGSSGSSAQVSEFGSDDVEEVIVTLTSKIIQKEAIPVDGLLADLLKRIQAIPKDEAKFDEKTTSPVPITLQIAEKSSSDEALIYSPNQDGALAIWPMSLKDIYPDDELYVSALPESSIARLLFRVVGADGIGQKTEETSVGGSEQYPLVEGYDAEEEGEEDIKIDHYQRSFSALLEGTSIFVMPRFQREFAWNKSNFDVLWNDIDPLWNAEESRQFLGAIVTRHFRYKKGDRAAHIWVIDGQQRLTTLYAIIVALSKVALEGNFVKEAESFASLLFCGNQVLEDVNRPAIMPTDNDMTGFNKLLTEIKFAYKDMKLENDYGKNTLLFNGWQKYLLPEVRKRCIGPDGKISIAKLLWLNQIIKDRLIFIQIDVPKALNPHKVFDRLNTQGKKLSTADLVRNLIFENLIDDSKRAEEVHKDLMLPFEALFNYEEGGQNKSKLDDFYFPFALTLGIDKLTKANMFSKLRIYWGNKDPSIIIGEMKDLVPAYLALSLGLDSIDENDPLRQDLEMLEVVKRLKRLNVPSSIFSYLMPLLESFRQDQTNKQEVIACITVIESYMVRRGFCGLQSGGFQTLFRSMWVDSGREPNSQILFNEIVSRSGYEFPSDSRFEEAIDTANMYQKKALSRFVLHELELEHPDSTPKHKNKILDLYSSGSTIEHIVPQDTVLWEAEVVGWNWELNSFKQWKKEKVDRIANLTILQDYENAQTQNNPWSKKQQYYLKKTIYNRPTEIAEEFERFDANAYEKRLKDLIIWFKNRWPRPD